MYIGKVSDIGIDISMLKLISMDCKTSKCIHLNCCFSSTKISETDKERISKIEGLHKKLRNPIASRVLGVCGFINRDEKISCVDVPNTEYTCCIFFNINKCILEKFDAVPLFCKAFPVLIDEKNGRKTMRLDLESNSPCLMDGYKEAYKILKEEIILLTNEDFYIELCKQMDSLIEQGFYYHTEK